MANYIGIGAGRCGTTSLHKVLRRHPDIFQLKRKEVHYFDRKYEGRPIEWYLNLFARRPSCVTGEITPSYFFVPSVPERIHKHLPNVKLLVLLRNPIEAMLSSYWRMVKRGQTKAKNVEEFLERRGKRVPLVERRYYAQHLRRWFEHFDREQFWIVQSERLFAQPNMVLNRLWSFLGVPKIRVTTFPRAMRVARPRELGGETREKFAKVFEPMNEDLYELLGEKV